MFQVYKALYSTTNGSANTVLFLGLINLSNTPKYTSNKIVHSNLQLLTANHGENSLLQYNDPLRSTTDGSRIAYGPRIDLLPNKEE
jgi:hypothetical protein